MGEARGGVPRSLCTLNLSLPPDDTFAFWRGLKDAGLLDEVIQEFHQELVGTMKGLQQRVQDPPLQLRGEGLTSPHRAAYGRGELRPPPPPPEPSAGGRAHWPVSPADAVLLNNIVQNFGMLDLVKKVLAGHKCQMDRSREQYARDLAGVWGPVPSRPLPSPRTAAPEAVRQGLRPGGRLVLSPLVMLRLPWGRTVTCPACL